MTTTDERLERIEGVVDRLSTDVEKLTGRVDQLSTDVGHLATQVEKLSYRFDIAQSTGERLERLATSLIAGATISIIAGVIFTLVKQ